MFGLEKFRVLHSNRRGCIEHRITNDGGNGFMEERLVEIRLPRLRNYKPVIFNTVKKINIHIVPR